MNRIQKTIFGFEIQGQDQFRSRFQIEAVEFIYDKTNFSFHPLCNRRETYLLRSLHYPRHFDHPVDRTAAPLVSPSERVPRKSGAFSTNRRGECDYRIRAVRILHFVTQTRLERLRRIQKTHPSDRRVRELADSYATHRKRHAWDSNANELRERQTLLSVFLNV